MRDIACDTQPLRDMELVETKDKPPSLLDVRLERCLGYAQIVTFLRLSSNAYFFLDIVLFDKVENTSCIPSK